MGYKPFYEINKEFTSEEEKFLYAANNAEIYDHIDLKVRHRLGKLPGELSLKLNKNISVIDLNYDILNVEVKPKKNYIFYNYENQTVYQLDFNLHSIVESIKAGLTIKEILNFDEETVQILEDLLYFRILEPSVILPIEIDMDLRKQYLRFNNKLLIYDSDVNSKIYLFNQNTGNVMRVNRFSYMLLKLFSGNSSTSEILTSLMKKDIAVEETTFYNLVNEAIRSNILEILNTNIAGPAINIQERRNSYVS
ncbi:hypothetical protein [Zhaonella formicivorans]|uniref:hypothetical protein n=1 Tax=Zhaonella formicivorans TaxID=2528593 RepID=UPI0010E940E1|nr:hypothetical protein [Zhaonella formicivorans]